MESTLGGGSDAELSATYQALNSVSETTLTDVAITLSEPEPTDEIPESEITKTNSIKAAPQEHDNPAFEPDEKKDHSGYSKAGPSETDSGLKDSQKVSGTWCSWQTVCVLVLLAVVVAAAVGLIVHFAVPCQNCPTCLTPSSTTAVTTTMPTTTPDQASVWQKCVDMSWEINQCLPGTPPCTSTTINPTTPTSSTPPPAKDYRLPLDLLPYHYDVELYPDIYSGDPSQFSFSGSVTIHLKCVTETDVVHVHHRQLAIDRDSVVAKSLTSQSGDNIHVDDTSTDPDTEFYQLHLARGLSVGENLTVQMNFTGPLKTDNTGMYLTYYDEGGVTKYMIASQFAPTDARKAFPCLDEPQLKATFTMTLVHRNDFVALTNMPPDSTMPYSGMPEYNITRFLKTNVVMPTYVIAIAITQYTHIENITQGGLTQKQLRHWSRPEYIDAGFIGYSLDVSMTIFDYFEQYFNFEYELPKEDQISVNFVTGAMENWGLITYREGLLAWDPAHSSLRDKQSITDTIAHELLHQWLGNVVTCAWWSDLWLQEAMATYHSRFGLRAAEPDWDTESIYMSRAFYSGLDVDETGTGHPLYNPVDTPAEINAMAGRVTYERGSAVIRMISTLALGLDSYQKAMQRYVQGMQHGSATHMDLLQAWDEQAQEDNVEVGASITEIMLTWIRQAGHPVIKAERTGDNTVQLSQKLFLVNPQKALKEFYESPYGYVWHVPIQYTTSKNPTSAVTEWLHMDNRSIAVNGLEEADWLLLNTGVKGLYRVNYDPAGWKALTEQLYTDHTVIEPFNRAQLIDDAMTLTRAGELDQVTAFNITKYLVEEMEYIPWYTMNRVVDSIDLLMDNHPQYTSFREYLKYILQPVYNYVSWTRLPGEPLMKTYLRTLILKLACNYENSDCETRAVKLFQDWRDDPSHVAAIIDPDIREGIYCTAIRLGLAGSWEFMFDQYQTIRHFSDEIGRRRRALTCTRDHFRLNSYFTMAATQNEALAHDPAGLTSIMTNIANNPTGRFIAWAYLDQYWEDSNLATRRFSVLSECANGFSTQAELDKFERFTMTHPAASESERTSYEDIRYKIKANVVWHESNADTMYGWLEEAAVPPIVGQWRLPKSLVPSHYDVQLYPNIYFGEPANFSFTGFVRIYLQCVEPTGVIFVHHRQLEIDSDSIKVQSLTDPADGSVIQVRNTLAEISTEFYKIYLARNLAVGEGITVQLNFTGPLLLDDQGMYLSDYDENGQTKYLVGSQLQKTDARKMFPCLDEPQLKATFNMTLIHHTSFAAITNMPPESTEPYNDLTDMNITRYQKTNVVMSTYLLAVGISQFKHIDGLSPGGLTAKPISHWARPEFIDAGWLRYSLNVTMVMVDYLESYFDFEYDLPKLDQLALPDFRAGAMENWGLITYRETRLVWDPAHSTFDEMQRMTDTIGHELAHLWLGDLVTCEWWDDVWIQEGMAKYHMYPALKVAQPMWKVNDVYMSQTFYSALDTDGVGTEHPIYKPVITPSTLGGTSGIIYNKGSAVIRMVSDLILGPDNYRDAMRLYVRRRQYTTATHHDLLQAWDDQAKLANISLAVNISEVMKTWLYQAGYPVITVERQGGTQVLLTQKLFLMNAQKPLEEYYESPYGYKWHIPVMYATSTLQSGKEWLHLDNRTLDIQGLKDSDWLIVNSKVLAFYRVNYDASGWSALIFQLEKNHTAIDPSNRAQLIEDSMTLARAGELDQVTALRTSQYLTGEQEYLPWAAMSRAVDRLDILIDTQPAIFTAFQGYVRSALNPLYDSMGWKQPPVDQLTDIYLHSLVLRMSCRYGNPECELQSQMLFEKWMADPTNSSIIPPDMRESVYCTAIRLGNNETWNFLFDQYRTNNTNSRHFSTEYARRRSALACSTDAAILNSYFTMAAKGDLAITSHDPAGVTSIMTSVARNSVGRDAVFTYLDINWEDSTIASSRFTVLEQLAASYSSQDELDKFEAFVVSHPPSGTKRYDDMRYTINANIRWQNSNADDMYMWLENANSYRLPTNLAPFHYDVEMFPNIYSGEPEQFAFNGSVRIHLQTKQSTNAIYLHHRQLEIDRDSLLVQSLTDPSEALAITDVTVETQKEFYRIYLDRSLAVGEILTVQMTFNGPLTFGRHGMYVSSHAEDGAIKYMVATQFESTDARKAFPCLDEPHLKATYNMTVVHREDFTALTNMPPALTEPYSGSSGFNITRFQPSVTMSPYLVAVVIHQFPHIENTTINGKTLVRHWARPQYIENGWVNYSLPVALTILDYFGNYFNYEYELPKEDQISVPSFAAGAMENWGLVTYRETHFPWDPEHCTLAEKLRSMTTMTHALIHQWIGNVVTCAWWSDTWVQEGTVNFHEPLALAVLEPSWNMRYHYVGSTFYQSMWYDESGTTHPLYNPVETPAEIQSMFDTVSYEKGAAVVRMVSELVLGVESHQKAMQMYLKELKHGSATHRQLLTAWDVQAAIDSVDMKHSITEVVFTWLYQAGHPVITVQRAEGGLVHLSQKLFLRDPTKPLDESYQSPYGYVWHVPIAYTTALNPSASDITWLYMDDGDLTIGNLTDTDWLLLNYKLNGMYRVNYDTIGWSTLIDQLNNDHTVIDPTNRAQLIEDSMTLTRAGELDQVTALKTTQYLKEETEYPAWSILKRTISYLDALIDMEDAYSDFKAYIGNLTAQTYNQIGWEINPDAEDPLMDTLLRAVVLELSCSYGNTDCTDRAMQLFTVWQTDPNNTRIIVPDIRVPVYCSAIATGSPDQWDFLFGEYQSIVHFSDEKKRRRDALSCSTSATILSSLFNMAANEVTSDQESILSSVARNPVGRPIAWDYLKQNWDNPSIDDCRFTVLNQIVASHSTQSQLDEFEAFVRDHPPANVWQHKRYENIRYATKANMRWRETNADDMFMWLQQAG